ncbi:MAG: 2-amino-4-hydroxy-6-hydroxymethyldihydropteridine diphosphokinase [Chloroflexi bacterium]|nr:2-amino-4-hydroxy-6-hydroxymethyldihydropteridine diphosphokinase [Chloroflexota bacterium]
MRALLGLGANVGNRRANLRLALRWLARRGSVTAVASLYESPALVLEGASPAPPYLNTACAFETDLEPPELLAFVKEIEREIGRRRAARWAPRPIDIDIELYGDRVVGTPRLTLPHPGMTDRGFVLLPLAEIAPEAVHPPSGRSVGELAEDIAFDGLLHIATWDAEAGDWRHEPEQSDAGAGDDEAPENGHAPHD